MVTSEGTVMGRMKTLGRPLAIAVAGLVASTGLVGLAVPALASTVWVAAPLPPGSSGVGAISCVPAAGSYHCVAVGANTDSTAAAVMTTDDGGASWTSATSIPAGIAQLSGVSCVTPTSCWAVGNGSGSASPPPAAILATSDGGKTWTAQAPPAGETGLQRVACTDTSHCWAVSFYDYQHVVATTDGGATWTTQDLPADTSLAWDPEGVAFPTPGTGYVVAGSQCGGYQVTECPGFVFKTTDGGATWTRLAGYSGAVGNGVSCIDANHCWVATSTFTTGVVWATANGGSSWAKQPLPSFSGYLNDISCASTRCVVVGANENSDAPVIADSVNGGLSWAMEKAPAGTGALWGVHLAGTTAAWIAGQNPGGTAATVLLGRVTPSVVVRSPYRPFQLGKTLTVTYTASDTGGPGVASYDVRYRVAAWNSGFGSYRYPAAWQRTTSTSETISGSAGHEYCFSVRARDTSGLVSAWSAPRCTALPLDDRSLTVVTSGAWTRGKAPGYYHGTYTKTKTYRAKLRRANAQLDRLALVVTRCSSCGKVAIYLNGHYWRTVSTYHARTQHKVVLTLPTFRLRTATVVLKAVSKGRLLLIDGLGVTRN